MATTVWVVDDDDAVRGALQSTVKELGYEVRAFSKAEEALAQFRAGRPDVVITDVRMPGMNGLDLTRALQEVDPNVVVLILTAYPSIPDAVESIHAGAADFLAKPFRVEEIRLRLERALENRRLLGRLHKTRTLTWCLIASLPVWFVLGILLAWLLR